MFDDQDGVAEVAEVFECVNETLIVALVEADGGFVENVEYAAETGADLGGEADALAFAAGEGSGGAGEGEVAEADGVEEFEAFDDFALEAVGDEAVTAGESEGAGGGEGALEGEAGEVGDGDVVASAGRLDGFGVVLVFVDGRVKAGGGHGEGDGEGFGAETGAVAAGALGGGHEAHHVLAIALGFGLFHVVAEVAEDAVKAEPGAFAARWAVEEKILLRFGEIFEGLFNVDLELFGCKLDCPQEILGGGAGPETPVKQGFGPVGDHFSRVEVVDGAEAVALGAGAVGGVEAEGAGFEFGDVDAAVGAGHGRGEEGLGVFAAGGLEAHEDEAVGEGEGGGDGGLEAFCVELGFGWALGDVGGGKRGSLRCVIALR